MCACVCSVMSDSATPWTVACQAPLSMEFSSQESWSQLPFPTPHKILTYIIHSKPLSLNTSVRSSQEQPIQLSKLGHCAVIQYRYPIHSSYFDVNSVQNVLYIFPYAYTQIILKKIPMFYHFLLLHLMTARVLFFTLMPRLCSWSSHWEIQA